MRRSRTRALAKKRGAGKRRTRRLWDFKDGVHRQHALPSILNLLVTHGRWASEAWAVEDAAGVVLKARPQAEPFIVREHHKGGRRKIQSMNGGGRSAGGLPGSQSSTMAPLDRGERAAGPPMDREQHTAIPAWRSVGIDYSACVIGRLKQQWLLQMQTPRNQAWWETQRYHLRSGANDCVDVGESKVMGPGTRDRRLEQ